MTAVREWGAVGLAPQVGRATVSIDTAALQQALQEQLEGEVRFDEGSRGLYSTDASNYRQVPIGVVIPRSLDDVVAAVALCRRFGAPILSRGGGTSLAGQCCNLAVVIDFSKYLHNVLQLDPARRLARVQPGTILDDLRSGARKEGLTFGPDPATHNHCTLGGMIGNNSCGVHSITAGRTAENVDELDVLTYDGVRLRVGKTSDAELDQIIAQGGRRGEIYSGLRAIRDRYAEQIRARYPKIPRRVSGYNLDELLPENGFNVARALVGTESTCVTVLEATLRLVPDPPVRSLLVLGYPDAYQAADHVPEIMAAGPIGLEGFDYRLVDGMEKKGLNAADIKVLPEGRGWLLAEFGGESKAESDDQARHLMAQLNRMRNPPSIKLLDDPSQEKMVWEVRESALGATARVPRDPDTWPGWEDSAVAPERLGGYLRDLRSLVEQYGYNCALYGHFGQGCIHTRIDFDLRSADGIKTFKRFVEDAAQLVVGYGGSLSGEHGDGQSRAELLPLMFGEELVRAFREFKSVWDPAGGMNPGKVVDPYPIEQNLRLGADYRPPRLRTHFQLPDDEGSFARATTRCVGVGKCRRTGGGTMCPSYMVTREEQHSTRGRARLLFEMLQGDPVRGGWRDEHVKEALDLCLACKGCKGDCPVNVDMATYKAEFLSHYFAGRLRPSAAYAFGLIYWWAGLASRMPGVVNLLAHAPGLGRIAKAVAGVAPQRSLPRFAPETFTAWFRRRPPRNLGLPTVILWPDTFNNHLRPATAASAVEALEAAGFRVDVPRRPLCCGRPLYDYGMLDLAQRLLRQILEVLRPSIRAGVPIVVLEPSCAAVFRDEMINLFPHDGDARRLSRQTYLLSEFLEEHAAGFQLPTLKREAIVHGHCHHKAVMKMTAEEKVLRRVGLNYTLLDSGCCGMAGAFGFEKDHYEVSVKAGERVLLPAVRDADEQTLVIADGFSCRTQIEQLTNRRALHLADVISMAIHEGPTGPAGPRPEQRYLALRDARRDRSLLIAAALSLGLAVQAIRWVSKRRREGG